MHLKKQKLLILFHVNFISCELNHLLVNLTETIKNTKDSHEYRKIISQLFPISDKLTDRGKKIFSTKSLFVNIHGL